MPTATTPTERAGSARNRDAAEPGAPAPAVGLAHLDALWFQVAGTVCNLRCSHCFISCAPDNHALGFLELEEVTEWIERSRSWGVKEYYYTGGEPFMHRDLLEMLRRTLAVGPATVLTNGTLLSERTLDSMADAERASIYSLEIRVSVDGVSPETNDPIRGDGTFERAMEGIRRLLEHGFLPILTATQVWDPKEDEAVRRGFVARLRELGYDRPRLKILPSLKIGREVERSGGYTADERVTTEMLEGYDEGQLICTSARVVTTAGVHVCPILLDEPDSRLGSTLEEADRPFELSHRACHTCWLHGAICSNYGGVGLDGT